MVASRGFQSEWYLIVSQLSQAVLIDYLEDKNIRIIIECYVKIYP